MDKDKIHIDNGFIDQSWEEMTKLLDKEMPVKRKRRPFFWLWFLGIGLVTSTLLVYNWEVDTATKKESPTLPVQKEFPHKGVNNINKPIEKELNKVVQSLKNEESSDKIHAFNFKNKPNIASPKMNLNTIKDAGAGNELSLKKETFIFSELNKEEHHSPSNTQLNNQEEKINHDFFIPKTLANFNQLPKSSIAPLPLNSKIIPIEISFLRPKKSWNIGIYAAMVYPSLGGWNGGVYSSWQFHPRWSLFTSFGYTKRKISSSTNDEALALADVSSTMEMQENADLPPATSTTAPNNPMDFMDQLSNPNSYNGFYYLTLPMLVQHQTTPRLSLELGGQIGRLIGVQFQQNGQQSFTTNFGSFTNLDTRVQNNTTLSRWDYGLVGGANFKIAPKLKLTANFHYSLNAYLQIEDANTKKWRQIHLGLRYQLN